MWFRAPQKTILNPLHRVFSSQFLLGFSQNRVHSPHGECAAPSWRKICAYGAFSAVLVTQMYPRRKKKQNRSIKHTSLNATDDGVEEAWAIWKPPFRAFMLDSCLWRTGAERKTLLLAYSGFCEGLNRAAEEKIGARCPNAAIYYSVNNPLHKLKSKRTQELDVSELFLTGVLEGDETWDFPTISQKRKTTGALPFSFSFSIFFRIWRGLCNIA